jgi:hypothetical protein
MRNPDFKRTLKSCSTPIYTFDTDASLERVIRDPMAVLLGRSTLSVQREAAHTDPYNRVGRWARAR